MMRKRCKPKLKKQGLPAVGVQVTNFYLLLYQDAVAHKLHDARKIQLDHKVPVQVISYNVSFRRKTKSKRST